MAQKGQGGGFARRQAEEAERRRAIERRRALATIIGIGAILVIIAAVAIVLRSRNQTTSDAAATTAAVTTTSTTTQTGGNTVTPTSTTSAGSYPGACTGTGVLLSGERPLAALAPKDRNNYYKQAPASSLEAGTCYEVVFTTARGEMRFRLLADVTPLTVNNFVFLATQGFYDGTTFHRVLENFMAQGGDPSGSGSGGPGYRFADEVKNANQFSQRGLLAMANAGPNTNGSQFFITFVPTPWLNGNHTIFGVLIAGDDVLSQIRLRDPQTDPQPGDTLTRVDIYAYK